MVNQSTVIDLGFPDERESAWLTNRYFPNKIGGLPAWLELELLPSKETLECGKCKAPMSFLCQIYAPFDDEHNFHRAIYVFICRAATCQEANSAKNLKVLRSQLGRRNDFYSEKPPEEDGDPLPAIAARKPLCLACGCAGLLLCARCKKASYCSAQHQRAHWKQHKKICMAKTTETEQIAYVAIPEIVFGEKEIVIELSDQEATTSQDKCESDDEAAEKQHLLKYESMAAAGKIGVIKDTPDADLQIYAQTAEAAEKQRLLEYELMAAAGKIGVLKDTPDTELRKYAHSPEAAEKQRLLEYEMIAAAGKTGIFKDIPDEELDKYAQSSDAVDDKHFRKFKKEIRNEPEQILRYKRNGAPLWIADVKRTIAAQLNIPNCEYCNGGRQFEFQIMPQMLVHLKDENLDWGVLAVYTCAKSCKPPADIGYLEEYIVKQDIPLEMK